MADDLDRALAAWRRDVEEGAEAAVKALADAVLAEASKIVAKEAIDRGDLLQSGEVARVGRWHYRVAWRAQQAVWVEFGTRPHWPPLGPIVGWVRRNMRVRVVKTRAGRERRTVIKPGLRRGTKAAQEAEVQRVARAIQAKIARKGTRPVRFATRASREVARRSDSLMRRAFLRVGRVP